MRAGNGITEATSKGDRCRRCVLPLDPRSVTPEHVDHRSIGNGKGRRLRIDLHGVPKPADIAEGIRFAIKHGWSSEPFYIGFTDLPDVERFVVRSADSPDYWRELEPPR